jgi:hypothetical protein
MRILVQVVDAIRVEQGRAPLDAVYDIPFLEEKLGQVSSVLTRDACDKCSFFHLIA